MSSTALQPVENREVVRCDCCHLVQFRAANNNCRKCKTSLDEDEPEPILAPVDQQPAAPPDLPNIALSIRRFRHQAGLSQRQLSVLMGVPRTYVSKVENGKATPILSSLERLAQALKISQEELVIGEPAARRREIRNLLRNPFIAEIAPALLQLDPMQRSSVMMQIRELATRPMREV